MPFVFNPFTGNFDDTGPIGVIPEYTQDPSSPQPEDAWVRYTAATGGGSPVGLLLGLTKPAAGQDTYELRYRTLEGTTVAIPISTLWTEYFDTIYSIVTKRVLIGGAIDDGASFLQVEGAFRNGTLFYPTTDGTAGQAITTDGAGNLTFQTSGGIFTLDVDGNIYSANAVTPTTGYPGADNFFVGVNAGDANAGGFLSHANFIGENAGSGASGAAHTNAIGTNAGVNAIGAYHANFIGLYAGNSATNALRSNFIGAYAGWGATNASFANFLGYQAGLNATDAVNSLFLGPDAGNGATTVNSGVFLGNSAGFGAIDATDSIFIGSNAGYADAVNNNSAGGTSIAIGRYSGTGGFSDSVAIGHGVINSAANQMNFGNVFTLGGIYASDTQSSTPVSGSAAMNGAFSVTGSISGNASMAVYQNIGGTNSAYQYLGGAFVIDGSGVFGSMLYNIDGTANASAIIVAGDLTPYGFTANAGGMFHITTAGDYARWVTDANLIKGEIFTAGNYATGSFFEMALGLLTLKGMSTVIGASAWDGSSLLQVDGFASLNQNVFIGGTLSVGIVPGTNTRLALANGDNTYSQILWFAGLTDVTSPIQGDSWFNGITNCLNFFDGTNTTDLLFARNNGQTVVVTTAALTGGGTQGSQTFTLGILTAQTQAT